MLQPANGGSNRLARPGAGVLFLLGADGTSTGTGQITRRMPAIWPMFLSAMRGGAVFETD